MGSRERQEARDATRDAHSGPVHPPRLGQSSLEASTWHAHDEPPQGAQMSPSQCEAARAEPRARDAAHRLPAASAPEATTPASDTLPASLLELRTPSQLCCWANGCYPLPPVIPLSQQHALSKLGIRISIQLPGNAHKRLQELAGVDGGAVQLRTIAVQQTTVLLDEEVDQPPGGKALWISLPTADLHIGVVYLYLLAKADGASTAPWQLNLFASLPILALPTAIGSELEDLFGTMIQEMSSREEAGEASSTCGSEGGREGGSDGGSTGDSDGGSSAGGGTKGQLQRCLSAPVVSIHRSQRAPREAEGCRWRDRMQGWSVRSANVLRGSIFSNNSRAGAGSRKEAPAELSFPTATRTTEGGSSTTGTMYSPASSFSHQSYSLLPSPSASQGPSPRPLKHFSLYTERGSADMSGRTVSGLCPLNNNQQFPPTLAGMGSQAGTSQQAAQNLPPPPAQPYQQPGQQQEQKDLTPAGLKEPRDLAGSAPTLAQSSFTPTLPGGLPNLQAVLPDDVADTLNAHIVGLTSLAAINDFPASHTIVRSAASACNLALSLLSNRSPSVRSIAKSMHDGYSSYAGLIAASKRMHIYASSAPLVAATFSTHFGPLSADLGYVLETAERCVAFRSKVTGTQGSPAGVLNAMGVDTFLLTEIVEDMSRLFCDQGTTLCSALVHQAAKKLEGTAV